MCDFLPLSHTHTARVQCFRKTRACKQRTRQSEGNCGKESHINVPSVIAGPVGKCESSSNMEPINLPVSEFPSNPDTGILAGSVQPRNAAPVTAGLSFAHPPSNWLPTLYIRCTKYSTHISQLAYDTIYAGEGDYAIYTRARKIAHLSTEEG